MNTKKIMLMLALVLTAMTTASAQDDASYEVTFNIPETATQSVNGYEVLHFQLQRKQDVTLEFHGDAIGSYAIVNGKKVPLTASSGRIVVPKKRTRVGSNTVQIDFSVADQRLSRHDDYICTLAMPDGGDAMFPCLGGSDVPIKMTLSLNLPDGWKGTTGGSATTPMPPSRASFTAVRMDEAVSWQGQRSYSLFHRSDLSLSQSQADEIAADVAAAVDWMERYTGIACPMEKVALVLIPGHRQTDVKYPGALLVGEKAAVLSPKATADDKLRRQELLAHEVAHLWFGSLVSAADAQATLDHETMAAYLASEIVGSLHPEAGEAALAKALNRAKHTALAPVNLRTEIDRLEQAGLPYGYLRSDRATIMMHKLVDLMGEETFRTALQQYLADHAYGSATGQQIDEAIRAADPSINLDTHINSWTTHSGLPTIETSYENGCLVLRRKLHNSNECGWNQQIDVRLIYEMSPSQTLTINMLTDTVVVPLPKRPDFIIPNFSGMGYARFRLSPEQARQLAERPLVTRNPQNRRALLQTLYDNYLSGSSSPYYFGELIRVLESEKEPTIVGELCHQLGRLVRDAPKSERVRMEQSLLGVMLSNQLKECHQGVIATLSADASCKEVIDGLYSIWQRQSDPKLTATDYTQLAYRLALLRPGQAQAILQTQRSRLTDALSQQEFDYVSRACTADTALQHQLFLELLQPAKRAVEPWAIGALELLSSSMREPLNNYMIAPGLQALSDIEQTGSQSLPTKWVEALLGQHTSQGARQLVKQHLESQPDYPVHLRNAILEGAYELLVE